MSITVTWSYTPAGTTGASLKVIVLTGASEAGGAGVTGSATGAPAFPLTPNFSHSLPAFAIYDGTGGSAGEYTAAANNTLLDNGVHVDAFCDGYYSGTTVAGTPVTVGSSTPTGTDTQIWAAYEIGPSGVLAPAVDASTPAAVHGPGLSSVTTAAFTPPAGSVLAALCTGNYSAGGSGAGATVSDSSSLAWTQRELKPISGDGLAAVFTATVPVPGVAVPVLGGGRSLLKTSLLYADV